MLRPLLVGESNPHSSVGETALLPWPRGAAGDRLRLILGLTDREYMRRFDRANLLGSPNGVTQRWDAKVAAASAAKIGLDHSKRILLGSRVARAFGVPFRPFHRFFHEGRDLLVLPHPSGRCRIWNDRRSARRARAAVRRFLDG